MSNKANKTIIGAFVVGSIILIIIAVVLFGSVKLFNHTTTFVMFFEKSISGLTAGSPVVFMGVPVGKVIDISVDNQINEIGFTIPVYIELYENTHTIFIKHHVYVEKETEYLSELIKQGLRASLAQQSLLTGQLMIELSFVSSEHQNNHFSQLNYYKGIPVIPTVPSKLDNIWKELTNLPFDKIAANMSEITESLKVMFNTPEAPNIIPNLSNFLHQGTSAVAELKQTIEDLRRASKKYGKILDNTNAQLNRTLNEAIKSLQTINTTTERLLGSTSPTFLDINNAIQEFSKAAKAVRILATTLERNPEALIRGKGVKQP